MDFIGELSEIMMNFELRKYRILELEMDFPSELHWLALHYIIEG